MKLEGSQYPETGSKNPKLGLWKQKVRSFKPKKKNAS